MGESIIGQRAISLIQPWATLIVAGVKRFETHAWGTSYRGPLLIHASKTIDNHYLGRPDVAALVLKAGISSFPTGAIVGQATLSGCVRTDEFADLVSDTELLVGDFETGRFAWAMREPRQWERPVACRGHLKIWTVKDADLIHGNRGGTGQKVAKR